MLSKLCRSLFCLTWMFTSIPIFAATCADLGRLNIDSVSINETANVANGTLEQRFGADLSLPAHCKVAAVLSPSDDSAISMELWLPEKWNGKFLALGNGGWAGSISFSAMAIGLQAGYAVASNDTGHTGSSASFAVGHPEKVVDFAWRAMHEMVVNSKTLIENYYQRPPQFSYYQGCSTGGRQGMMSAQRFPEDFDAIIAGAPVYNQLALNAVQFHNMKSLIENRSLALSPEKVQLLHNALMTSCEANDGVADGFLNNPLACSFEPEVLRCESAQTSVCLTAEELSSVDRVFNGTYGSNGTLLYPGHAPGFELGWRIPAENATPSPLQTEATQYVAYEDPNWDWREFELERDLALVRNKAGFIEALDADLSEFKARGGKILFYHGWNDPGPSPINTINYYNDVLTTVDGNNDDWLRLFMMPGMGHCRGGVGPDQADFLGTMEAWFEKGITPQSITSSRIREGRVDMTRPLCAYPSIATWDKQGNPNDVASYDCQIQ